MWHGPMFVISNMVGPGHNAETAGVKRCPSYMIRMMVGASGAAPAAVASITGSMKPACVCTLTPERAPGPISARKLSSRRTADTSYRAQGRAGHQ